MRCTSAWIPQKTVTLLWALAAAAAGCGESRVVTDARVRDGGSSDARGELDAEAPTDAAVPGDAGLDAGELADARPAIDAGPDAGDDSFAHCPPPSAFVGDAAWGGRLVVGDALYCAYPRQFNTLAEAAALKDRARVVSGEYPFPLAAAGAPYRLPACVERAPGAPEPSALVAGTVSAERRQNFDDPSERYYVSGELPRADGTAPRFRVDFRTAVEQPRLEIGGVSTDFSALSLTRCATPGCDTASDVRYYPCTFASNTCDEVDFTGGTLKVDQYHWAGAVGAGFAAPVRVRGALDGTTFDLSSYTQLTLSFGHHAFSRGLRVMFDAPIGGACGLEVEEIAEGASTEVHLLDCAGVRLSSRARTAERHLWRMPCR